jgi:hypothetical protein
MAQSSANLHNPNDIIVDLEKKLELLTKGSSSYYSSLFKNLFTENKSNAKILYEFLETEHNIQNVKLSTIVTHVKAICLFNEYLSYKDFENITKEDIIYYLSSFRKTERLLKKFGFMTWRMMVSALTIRETLRQTKMISQT